MASEISDRTEPYQVLFLAGALAGLVGANLWILFGQGLLGFYPKVAHGSLMFAGLLWGFIAGFLMTAIPKMTSTAPARGLDIGLATGFVLLQIGASFASDPRVSSVIFLIQNVFLIQFILVRFLKFRKIPFSGFLFLPLAFLASILGVCLSLFSGAPSSVSFLLSGEAFVCNLIVGLGSRLVPVISRLPGALSPVERSKAEQWVEPVAVALGLNLGYLLQAFLSVGWGLAVKILALSYAAIRLMGLFRKPSVWSMMAVGLKLSVVLLILGQVLAVFALDSDLASLHLTYIGGFVAITFLISMRVTLAHGDQPLTYEVHSPRLAVMTALFVLSGLARHAAGPNPLSALVTVSVFLFTCSAIVWAWKFVKVIVRLRSNHGVI